MAEHHHDHEPLANNGIYVIAPSGAIHQPERLTLATQNLKQLGFKVKVDRQVKLVEERFAGSDSKRLEGIERSLVQPFDIVMAARGGYGLSRLLPAIDFNAVADSGKVFVGHSDFTAFNLALLAQTGQVSYTGPSMVTDFGVKTPNGLTAELFGEVMRGELEILSFQSPGSDPFDGRGVLWGGNLAMTVSLLGTPHFPKIKGGILFVEDVNEHPYRIERMLLQLAHAGVLAKQKALILGHFTDYKVSAQDRGYDMASVIEHIRKTVGIPVITGLPYGHTAAKVTLPIGAKVGLATEAGMAYLVIHEH
ncbi:LD-carboxypeptidase [Orrella daihaiensis]|uniref:LD-carboxypeptidase n=1 Tax=Orrella daihaiensis TaxID=2782176 RepID=A0ABY4AGU8_9BURK|nr:LD-carboxypeptidase [Orrella daihaiensis]UOD49298.1 LD-carboxypeptidase [Orrella daihaiensis]